MKETSKAHALLDYLLTKAVTAQETISSQILLDYHDMCCETEDVLAVPQEANNIKVKVSIKLEWDLSEEMFDLEELLKGEDEDESDDRFPSDKDKESH